MREKDLDRNSLREGLKAKGRLRRESLKRRAAVERGKRHARNDLLPGLKIEAVPIDSLRSYSRRLRKSDAAHAQEIANSIGAFGFSIPLLIGKENVVIDGEVRLEAARLLALTSVPCIRIDHLSEDEQRLLRLAANRLGEKGSWDLEELRGEFEELIIAEAPIELSGFGLDEIDELVIGEDGENTEVGDLSPAPGEAPVTRIGDLFHLGSHRVICGDSTDPAIVSRLMQGRVARLILTDEPFNVPISGHVTGGGHREFVMASGEMTDDQFLEFNRTWIGALLPHLVDGGIFGTFIDWRGLPIVHAAATGLGLSPLNLVVWAKTNAGMGSLYRSQHELLPLFKKGQASHVNNVALGKRGRHRSNVWTYPGASSQGSDARRGLQDHPTVKPTAMLRDALIDLSHRDEIILEPFGGSGSTLIACETTGRVCRCIELDPLYVDVIVRRYQRITGQKAILEEGGETFDELETRRKAGSSGSCVNRPAT
jgi:DNA modification methylase